MKKSVKKLFIPHKGNDYKPNIFERASMAVMLLMIALTFAAANIQSLIWVGSDFLVSTVLPSVVIDLTNEERIDEDLKQLKRNPTLDTAARLKAEHMAKHEYFAHYSPDGTSPWYWFDEVSYQYLHAGENLAVHFNESNEVVDAWMESPLHKENIVNKKYTEIGVGTAQGFYKGFPTVYVVQLFGTPRTPVTNVATTQLQVVAGTQTEEITLEVQSDVSGAPNEGVLTQASFETFVVEDTKEELEVVEENPVSVSLASSVPATTEPIETAQIPEEIVPESTFVERSAVSSSVWLGIVYGVLALFVVVALTVSIVVEWRRQHPVHIAYSGGLLAVMALLFYIHTVLTDGVIIV